MRPNLSLEHIALTLAALGTTALTLSVAGCGGDVPAPQVPVQSVEVSAPAAPAAPTLGAAATVTAPAVPAAVTPPASAAGASMPSVSAAAAVPSMGPAAVTAGTTPPAKPKAPAATKKAGANGQASCGAGTCSASK